MIVSYGQLEKAFAQEIIQALGFTAAMKMVMKVIPLTPDFPSTA